MSIEPTLIQRADSKCELCGSTDNLKPVDVPPVDKPGADADKAIYACETCREQMAETTNVNHWHCLNESMWSQVPAVQVTAYRILKTLSEPWAQDALDMLYLDEEVKEWAENDGTVEEEVRGVPAFDVNGTELKNGDNVTLIKDLVVKGANFTAKQGTLVRGISLTDNPKHIEGKVGGTRIVLVAAFLKKA